MTMDITAERLARLFFIDFENGRLFWREPTKYHPRLVGIEAGCTSKQHNGKQYWVVKIDGRAFKRGRLMFIALHGRMPTPCVDHINGDSLNDRPENLREASITENSWNHKARARRIKLPMGVRISASSGRFQARISYNKKQLHLGAFDTPEEASAVYQAKRREMYREFA